ncbi:MAG: DUF2490 domain-containing protein [Candidatus Omnitrophota bacterium]|nr:DUF2490 domain-containing protein [Candidatus Omnitrophota bacterium]
MKTQAVWPARGFIRFSFLIAAASIVGSHPVAARDDWQLWLEQKWSVKLAKSLTLVGKTEERFQSDMSDFYSQIASVGFSWKAQPWLKLEPAYYYQWTERAGRDTNENRVYLNVTPGSSWGRFRFEDRNRIEFRHINRVDDWRYRNKPKLSVGLGRGWYEVSPYVADEVFYGARAGEWNRNRVYLGVEKPLTKALDTEVYYMIESNKTGRDWNEFHILGLSLSVKF